MIRKQKPSGTNLIRDFLPDFNTVNLKEIRKSDLKSTKSQKLILSKQHLKNMLYKFSDDYFLVETNNNYVQQLSTILPFNLNQFCRMSLTGIY